jgi:hypothetical protein
VTPAATTQTENNMTVETMPEPKTAQEARQQAVDWQHWQSTQNLSWSETGDWCCYFEKTAEQFGLTEEFKENGII